ncbi:hypothetical protein [Nocardioides marmoraquaticus]
MTQRDFAQLPVAVQTNLLLAASLAEALRYWVPATAAAADIKELEAVVWATVAGCTRMFSAGERGGAQALASYERLIAAVPDDWAQTDSAV